MARTFTSGQRAVLGGQSMWIYGWFYILDTDGNWRDCSSLTPLAGGPTYDYFDSFTWTEDIDVPVAQGSVTLRRQIGPESADLSLAPAMSTSALNLNMALAFVPLLSSGREFKVVVASVATGTARSAVASGDMIEIARGKVDQVDWTADPIRVTLRDDGAWLQNAYIMDLANYATGVGTPIETVMQQIINANPPKGGATLVLGPPGTSPGYDLLPFTQQRTDVMDALITLALQIGWDVRYRYDAAGVSELMLLNPPRTSTTPDYTMGPDEYTDVRQLTIDDSNVRNYIRVIYADSTTGGVVTVVATNPASIAEYGTRFYEITEQSSSNITTNAQATALANAIASDLGAPEADQEITTLLFWIVQLYDNVQFLANGKHYDQDQLMGVVSYTHTIQNGSGTTTIHARGQLAGAYMAWLTRFGINDVTLIPPPTPTFIITAEGSPDGGVTMDGMVFVQVGFEPNTQTCYIYSETTAAADPPVPDESTNTLNYQIQRPPGTAVADPYYTITVQIATTNGWWRTLKCFGVGPALNGQPGQVSVPVIQTIEAGTPGTTQAALPAFQTFTVVRDANGVTADIAWTLDLTGVPSTAVIYIQRNGQTITGAGISSGTTAFSDPNAPTDAATTYTIFLYSSGVTGPSSTATLAATNGTGSLAPVFDLGTPGYVVQKSTIPPSQQVVVGWTCPDTVADQIQLQVSVDGTTWVTVYDSGVVTAGAPPITSGSAYTNRIAREYLRLVTFGAGVQRLATPATLFVPIAAPNTGVNGLLPMNMATPYGQYVIGTGASIEFSYSNSFVSTTTVVLQKANAPGGPWTTVGTNTGFAATGTFSDLADYGTALFFRVAALNGATVLGIAAYVTWYPLPYTGFSAGTYTA